MSDAPSRAHAAALRLQALAEELLAEVDRLPADLVPGSRRTTSGR